MSNFFRQQIIKDHRSKIVQARKINGNERTITLSPKLVFDNLYDYEEFLKWRASNDKKTVSIAEAMEITNLPRKTIIKLIKKDKLVAKKQRSGTYEILKSSLLLHLFNYLINEKTKIEKAVEYLNVNGSTVMLKFHLSE